MGFFWLLFVYISFFCAFTNGLRTIFFHPLNHTVKPSQGITPDTKVFDYNFRLSGEIVPLEYHINFEFDLYDETLYGVETIIVTPTKDTQVLTLHVNTKYVHVTYAGIFLGHGIEDLKNPLYNKTRLTVTYFLPKRLKQNNRYWISFKFNTEIYEKNYYEDFQKGIMKSTVGGKKVFFTFFEMLGARRVFPCFDEPHFKANYQLNVTVRGPADFNSYIALSNSMSVKRGETWYFDKTLKMSTYLLNLVIGSFKPVCSTMGPHAVCGTTVVPGQSKKVCQWMTHNLAEQSDSFSAAEELNAFSVDVYCKMQHYINVESPAQLHFVWLPLLGVAVEHWGLISVSDRDKNTFAHEISHYWFGDLVSPKSWPHLWLNEGFASYITGYSDITIPHDRRAIIEKAEYRAADFYDEPNTASVVSKLWANDYETQYLYDINYYKGSWIALMAESILGQEKFRKALHNHMKAKAYGNANTDDLLMAFQHVSNHTVNIARVLENFLTYGGKPNLNIVYNRSKRIYNVYKVVPSGIPQDWILPLWAYDISRNISTINWIKDETAIIELSKITTSANPANIKWNYYHFGYYTFQVVN